MEDMIDVFGWELHNQSGNSDKFYRVLVGGTVVVTNWGRRGTRGQIRVHHTDSLAAATDLAREKTNEKEESGYFLTRDFTRLECATAAWRKVETRPADQEVARSVIEAFKQAAGEQGTATPRASA